MHYIPTSWTGKLDAMGITKNRCKETERRRRKKDKEGKKDKRLKRLKGMWRHISERENKEKELSWIEFDTFPSFLSLVLKHTPHEAGN